MYGDTVTGIQAGDDEGTDGRFCGLDCESATSDAELTKVTRWRKLVATAFAITSANISANRSRQKSALSHCIQRKKTPTNTLVMCVISRFSET